MLFKLEAPENLLEYTCDACSVQGKCHKHVTITDCRDILLVQLTIFKSMRAGNGIFLKKLNPNILIDETLQFSGETMVLAGIVYHHGSGINSGHYTCAVKAGESWYMINDSVVTIHKPKIFCHHQDSSVPYMLLYKKVAITNFPNTMEVTEANSDLIDSSENTVITEEDNEICI